MVPHRPRSVLENGPRARGVAVEFGTLHAITRQFRHAAGQRAWDFDETAVASLPAEVPASSNEETPARATRSMELEDAFEEGHIRAAEYHERLLAGETTVHVPVD